jgi:hypothetical protein
MASPDVGRSDFLANSSTVPTSCSRPHEKLSARLCLFDSATRAQSQGCATLLPQEANSYAELPITLFEASAEPMNGIL